jgi:hypothetical protein
MRAKDDSGMPASIIRNPVTHSVRFWAFLLRSVPKFYYSSMSQFLHYYRFTDSKASEMSRNQREMNEKIKEKYQAELFEILSKYDDTEGRTGKAYTDKRQELMDKWENDKVKREYDSMSEFAKKQYDRDWKRDIAKELKQMLRGQKIFGLPSKKAIQKEFSAEYKRNKAQLALPAAHGHTHAHDHVPAERPRRLTDIDKLDIDNHPPSQLSQFSYDNALWGAQTHTRARDSLRYL